MDVCSLKSPAGSPHAHSQERSDEERLAISEQNQCDSLLLRLPAELRIRVYEHVLADQTACCFYFEAHTSPNIVTNKKKKNALAVLATCRQIYTEAKTLPFALNTFWFQGFVDLHDWMMAARVKEYYIWDDSASLNNSIFGDGQKTGRWHITLRLPVSSVKRLGITIDGCQLLWWQHNPKALSVAEYLRDLPQLSCVHLRVAKCCFICACMMRWDTRTLGPDNEDWNELVGTTVSAVKKVVPQIEVIVDIVG
ncbi:hypothetical protein BU23DRAFT_604166 [Bimuria novae-zelandiae CBS 107.79]|uniref:Uncharacterized protein n=1 Tax=Bimuria novae-zelandiae CBS 107.79 TaxID=1447943 RepID=A0A6A5UNU5_9PLEO|nr:hypothetical protein BU23DRAFT_604166 [Bimuria novae-zelandiae CBS 107.79]